MSADPSSDAPPRRLTRAQQRANTRLTILSAAGTSLVQDGYAAMTTRRVAEIAGVAQSTLMHHFPSRETLLIETVTHLTLRLADDALAHIDLASLRSPSHRETVLDQAWKEFTSPEAVAAMHIWVAAWDQPELAATLAGLERGINEILGAAAAALFPDLHDDPEFPALLDVTVSLMRGLMLAVPISGREAVDQRWAAMKPVLLRAAAELLDRDAG